MTLLASFLIVLLVLALGLGALYLNRRRKPLDWPHYDRAYWVTLEKMKLEAPGAPITGYEVSQRLDRDLALAGLRAPTYREIEAAHLRNLPPTLLVAGSIILIAFGVLGCTGAPPTASQVAAAASVIANGAKTAAPFACAAEELLVKDPTIGNLCTTFAELEAAHRATQTTDLHTLCACVVAERAKSADAGAAKVKP